jgi:hypothetical protein
LGPKSFHHQHGEINQWGDYGSLDERVEKSASEKETDDFVSSTWIQIWKEIFFTEISFQIYKRELSSMISRSFSTT